MLEEFSSELVHFVGLSISINLRLIVIFGSSVMYIVHLGQECQILIAWDDVSLGLNSLDGFFSCHVLMKNQVGDHG